MGNLIETDETNARLIVKKLHVNWEHASASQLKRVLTNAGGVETTVLKAAGTVVDERDVRAAFGAAPRHPAAGTSLVSAFNGEAQADSCSGQFNDARRLGFVSASLENGIGILENPVGGVGCVCGVPDYGSWETALPADGYWRRVEERSAGGHAS